MALLYVSLAALASNVAVFIYMIYKVAKTEKNPYLGELYSDFEKFREVKTLAEE